MAGEFQLIGYLEVLAGHRVEYLLVGGVGARIQGAATTTQDLDIVPEPSPENLERLATALSDESTELKPPDATLYVAHPRVDAVEFRTASVCSYRTRFGAIAVLMELPGVGGYDAILRNARRYEWNDATLLVASLDDIIRSEQTAARVRDRQESPQSSTRTAVSR